MEAVDRSYFFPPVTLTTCEDKLPILDTTETFHMPGKTELARNRTHFESEPEKAGTMNKQ